jgi:hypothetical protein
METLLAKLAREAQQTKKTQQTKKLNPQRRTHQATQVLAKQVPTKASAGWPRRSLDYTQPSEHAASDRNQGSLAPGLIASSQPGIVAPFIGKLGECEAIHS